jgi:hypothetical protein
MLTAIASPVGSPPVCLNTVKMRQPPSSRRTVKVGPSQTEIPSPQAIIEHQEDDVVTKVQGQKTTPGAVGEDVQRYRKRHRTLDDSNDYDENFVGQPTQKEVNRHDSEPAEESEVGHRGLNLQMQHLSEQSRCMDRTQASAMAALLETVAKVDKNALVGVIDNLRRMVPVRQNYTYACNVILTTI